MKIAALAGGVGGAKFIDGLSKVLNPSELSVIVNTGDDFIHYGLHISPDLDTITYTLGGMANPTSGWGRLEDTYNMISSLEVLGGQTWFLIGDKDLAVHLERTRLLVDKNHGRIESEEFGVDVCLIARFREGGFEQFAQDLQNMTRGSVQAIIIESNANTIMPV